MRPFNLLNNQENKSLIVQEYLQGKWSKSHSWYNPTAFTDSAFTASFIQSIFEVNKASGLLDDVIYYNEMDPNNYLF